MTAKQYADLEKLVNRWIDQHCEDIEWPDVVIGNETAPLMAKAARCVFDAIVESRQYAKREGV